MATALTLTKFDYLNLNLKRLEIAKVKQCPIKRLLFNLWKC